jgi:hypothetical protein
MAHRDLAPEAEWQIWYQDMFDRECPRQIEISGQGLVNGLVELWAHHLFETVQANGREGFSRFNLWWKQRGQSIEIIGGRAGLARLKGWVFGTQQGTNKNTIQEGNRKLLKKVAVVHSHLMLTGHTSEAILTAAGTAADQQDFEVQLENLIA